MIKKGDLYTINASHVEVSLNIEGLDPDDEVTFLVSNVDSRREAIDRVWAFIQKLREHLKDPTP